jgi:hypothetical protein
MAFGMTPVFRLERGHPVGVVAQCICFAVLQCLETGGV